MGYGRQSFSEGAISTVTVLPRNLRRTLKQKEILRKQHHQTRRVCTTSGFFVPGCSLTIRAVYDLSQEGSQGHARTPDPGCFALGNPALSPRPVSLCPRLDSAIEDRGIQYPIVENGGAMRVSKTHLVTWPIGEGSGLQNRSMQVRLLP